MKITEPNKQITLLKTKITEGKMKITEPNGQITKPKMFYIP